VAGQFVVALVSVSSGLAAFLQFWAFIGTLPGAFCFISTCVWLALRAADRAKELEVARWTEDYENRMREARAWGMGPTKPD